MFWIKCNLTDSTVRNTGETGDTYDLVNGWFRTIALGPLQRRQWRSSIPWSCWQRRKNQENFGRSYIWRINLWRKHASLVFKGSKQFYFSGFGIIFGHPPSTIVMRPFVWSCHIRNMPLQILASSLFYLLRLLFHYHQLFIDNWWFVIRDSLRAVESNF